MHETLKFTWLTLTVFVLCAYLAALPYDKWQKSYMAEYYRIKNEPQRRIDAVYKYIEGIEDGIIDVESGMDFDTYLSTVPVKTEMPSAQVQEPAKKYQKPLYVRDKNDPTILHPYREN